MKYARNLLINDNRRGIVSLPILAIGLLLLVSPVLADKYNSKSSLTGAPDKNGDQFGLLSAELLDEIIVTEGPVKSHQEGRTKLGFPIEITELRRRVSYADLDLSRTADVAVFKSRVETAAKRSCEQLAQKQSVELSNGRTIKRCTDVAVHRSVKEIQAAIAANGRESGF